MNRFEQNLSTAAESNDQEEDEKLSFPVAGTELKRLRQDSDIRVEAGNPEADMNCICEILSGDQDLWGKYEFKNYYGQSLRAEKAIDYLYYQDSLQALLEAADKVKGFELDGDKIEKYIKQRQSKGGLNEADDMPPYSDVIESV